MRAYGRAVELEQALAIWLLEEHSPDIEWANDILIANSYAGVSVFHQTKKLCGYPVPTV